MRVTDRELGQPSEAEAPEGAGPHSEGATELLRGRWCGAQSLSGSQAWEVGRSPFDFQAGAGDRVSNSGRSLGQATQVPVGGWEKHKAGGRVSLLKQRVMAWTGAGV